VKYSANLGIAARAGIVSGNEMLWER